MNLGSTPSRVAMTHIITMFVEGDLNEDFEIDLENIIHDNCLELTYETVKTYPRRDIYHEVIWWITKQMTMDEWVKLDDAESEAISKIVGEDNFMGTAGPIPFED